MSAVITKESIKPAKCRKTADLDHSRAETSWESLCDWLTRELHGMETTIERRDKGGDWVVECLSFPLESVTTRTSNGVPIISIGVRMNGHTRLFEIAGPDSAGVRRNAAGWPIRVELGYAEGQPRPAVFRTAGSAALAEQESVG